MQTLNPRKEVLIPHQPRRSVGSAGALSQVDQSLSPSQGATAGDGIYSPDNTSGITEEQGQRPGGRCPGSLLSLSLLGFSPQAGGDTRRSQS